MQFQTLLSLIFLAAAALAAPLATSDHGATRGPTIARPIYSFAYLPSCVISVTHTAE
jgi:hypothetical protein